MSEFHQHRNTDDEEQTFLLNCQKIGLSPDQIFHLWNSKLQVKQAELQLNILKFPLSENKKRKLDELDVVDVPVLKKQNLKTFICDDALIHVLEYLNVNFDIYKWMIISKQFRKCIQSIKLLLINIKSNINNVITSIPRYYLSHIEVLQIENFNKNLIRKCSNVKKLKIQTVKAEGTSTACFVFTNPTIEYISISETFSTIHFTNFKFINLKHLSISSHKPNNFLLDSSINRYTQTLLSLYTPHYIEDISPIYQLVNLVSLNIEVRHENQIRLILQNLKKLELFSCFFSKHKASPEPIINVDYSRALNLKLFELYLCVDQKLCENIWNFNFANLECLYLLPEIDFDLSRFFPNNTFPNLNYFAFNGHEDFPINLPSFSKLKSLKSLFLFSPINFDGQTNLSTTFEGLGNLEKLQIGFNKAEELINFSKLSNLSNLKYLEISFENVFTKEFFQNLQMNFGELIEFRNSFKFHEDVEYLKEFKPNKLKVVTSRDNEMSSLTFNFLKEWKDIEWRNISWSSCSSIEFIERLKKEILKGHGLDIDKNDPIFNIRW